MHMAGHFTFYEVWCLCSTDIGPRLTMQNQPDANLLCIVPILTDVAEATQICLICQYMTSAIRVWAKENLQFTLATLSRTDESFPSKPCDWLHGQLLRLSI